jgi:hypothetical protein
MKITLRKALQLKNNMVGNISKIRLLIRKKNVFVRETTPESAMEDTRSLMIKLEGEVASLVRLKTALAKANVGIYETLCTLEELKARISFLGEIPYSEGKSLAGMNNGVAIYHNTEVHINEKAIRQMTEETQKEIEKLQEKVDEYNGTTFIEIED